MTGNARGGYHDWAAFLRCPNCHADRIDLDHYEDGTFVRCRECGAEAWAEGLTSTR
ncbi:MAG: hypothetical protein ACOCSN_03935 [Halanaeroarchaeum sp.]